MHLSDLEDDRIRRRALAAQCSHIAVSLERARKASTALGVPPPARVTPAGMRRWAADLEHANAIIPIDQPGLTT